MHTLLAFIEFVLAFVPFFGIALVITALLWAATKLFPSFGEWFNEMMDRSYAIDDKYDETYDTGYASNRFDEYV